MRWAENVFWWVARKFTRGCVIPTSGNHLRDIVADVAAGRMYLTDVDPAWRDFVLDQLRPPRHLRLVK